LDLAPIRQLNETSAHCGPECAATKSRGSQLNDSGKLSPLNVPTVEVSWGEFVDKITILEIKEQRLRSPEAVSNVRRELAALSVTFRELQQSTELIELKNQLKSINEMLWEIEDAIRTKEAAKSFDAQFIELARSVYFKNDVRARIKREINVHLKSELVEEKQHPLYS
jgi:hypothetical protein